MKQIILYSTFEEYEAFNDVLGGIEEMYGFCTDEDIEFGVIEELKAMAEDDFITALRFEVESRNAIDVRLILQGTTERVENNKTVSKRGGFVFSTYEELDKMWDELEEYTAFKEGNDFYISGFIINEDGEKLNRKYLIREITPAGEAFYKAKKEIMKERDLHSIIIKSELYSDTFEFSESCDQNNFDEGEI